MTQRTRKVFAALLLWLLAVVTASATDTVTYVYTDPQGTPLAETDAKGNITATFDYTPYGSTALGSSPNGAGYTGHVNDPESNLVYMQARYYDATIGRFISIDPVAIGEGNAATFNRYSYADNNPVINTDPTGRFAFGPQEFEDRNINRDEFSRRVDACPFCLDAGVQEARNLPGVTVTAKAPSVGAAAGGAIGFILSLPVDAFEDLSTGGVGAIANPVTTSGMTIGGAYVGNATQQGLTNLVQMMSKRFTSHGSDRANEAKTDSHRSVGDQNNVIKNGRKFIDNDTGNMVHVDGERVVITDHRGDIVTQFKNPRANTNARIASGRWTPL